MKWILSTVMALATTPAFGSYLEACDLTVTVKETIAVPALNDSVTEYQPLVQLHIDAATDLGSHSDTACERKVGTSQWLTLNTEDNVRVGDRLVIDYFYVNNRGPNGVMHSERWSIVEGREGQLVYSCTQVDRSVPTYRVELRRPAGPVRADAEYYNVYVTEDHEDLLSEKEVRVRYLSDQNGGISRILNGDAFSLELGEDQVDGGYARAAATLVASDLNLHKQLHCARH